MPRIARVLMTFAWLPLVLLAALVQTGTSADKIAANPPASTIDFVRQVQPIFVEHCYQCHGPDKQEAGLRLDLRAKALAGGDSGASFMAGKADESELIQRVTASDEAERMPPVGANNKPLAAEQIATLTSWINSGAEWPEPKSGSSNHWSFQPIERPSLPAVKNEAWVRTPIDRFVLAPLEALGTAPAPEADRYVLIKRLSYDLLGLPPSVAEVDAFVADRGPDAYERLVDRLLDSPRFGERWGRHWLDKARYADSDGYEKDNARPDAWRYRNWVIDAVNRDLPLDEFTVEQLAGDLLPGATPESRLATAFHRQTLTNTEGGTDQEQFRVEAIFDRVATTGAVWLGLTVGCAQCHSHKYDPISHEDYYRLFAYFNNGDESDTQVPLVGEALVQFETEQRAAAGKLAQLEPRYEQLRSQVLARLPAWEAELKQPAGDPLRFHPVELLGAESSAGAELKLFSDGSYLVAGKNPDVDKLTIKARADVGPITGFRLEALAHSSLGGNGPGRTGHGNFVLSEFRAFAASSATIGKSDKLKLRQAEADTAQAGFSPASAIDGKEQTGWAVGNQLGRDHWALFVLDKPIDAQATPFLQIVLAQNHGTQHTLGRFRLSAMTGTDPLLGIPADVQTVLKTDAAARTAEQTARLAEYFLAQDAKAQELSAEIQKLRQRLKAEPTMRVRVLAERTAERRTSHILHRGDFLDPQAEVRPGTLAALPSVAARDATANRLELARWLVAEQNPLTRRVLANQIWSHLFGRGIVRTVNDFGTRGDRPTHPELLDWLASELSARNWSRKELIRLIVQSAVYRQSAAHRAELTESDPLNDRFARQNRFRVEAELVRDLSLSAAGMLSDKVGGPSVFPPLPPDIAELSYANNFKWNVSPGEDRYRRGMYTFFKRTAPHPNLTTFDCPDSNTTCVERRASNTPLQALTTLNNESFVDAAQAMARRALTTEATDDRARLALALRWCLARPATDDELSALADLLSESRQWYAAHEAEAKSAAGAQLPPNTSIPELAAWFTVTRIMLNLDEFLNRE